MSILKVFEVTYPQPPKSLPRPSHFSNRNNSNILKLSQGLSKTTPIFCPKPTPLSLNITPTFYSNCPCIETNTPPNKLFEPLQLLRVGSQKIHISNPPLATFPSLQSYDAIKLHVKCIKATWLPLQGLMVDHITTLWKTFHN